MIMTPSKTASRPDASRLKGDPDWITLLGKHGTEATGLRDASTKSKAWWDLVANMIVGRR